MTSISIIIPIFNVESYISRCLYSVTSQTYKGPTECILVDDCGTDNSITMAEDIINKYQGPIRFRIIKHKFNRGLAAARNTGMNAARNEYIYFLDSDDEICPNCIENLAQSLTEEQYDLVIGDVRTIGDNTLNTFLRLKLPDGMILKNDDIVLNYRNNWNMMAQNKLYNVAFIRQHQLIFKEGLIHEDELWSFEIACLARTLKVVKSAIYIYYIRKDSITANSNQNLNIKIQNLLIIISDMTQFLLSQKIVSVHAYLIIQKFIEDILQIKKTDRQDFKCTYFFIRDITKFPYGYRAKIYLYNFRLFFSEIHYLLPVSIGEKYKYWRITK